MPAARTKQDLQAVLEKEWRIFWRVLDTVPDELRLRKDADDTSIKDILAHRAHWIGLFFQWVREARETGSAAMPDHGVKWNQLKPYNAGLRARYADLDWEEACVRLQDAHGRLSRFIAQASDDALYGTPFQGGTGWTMGRYAEAAGPSHYRSATKYLRARLREAAQS